MHWIQADWPAPPSIMAGTTLRQGGMSTGLYTGLNLATHVGDDLNIVKQNRDLLDAPQAPQWLEQVHSTVVLRLPVAKDNLRADASYTTQPGTVCAVMTADCLPLLITNMEGSCVAAIHAGWRGLCDGIIEKTIQALPTEADSLLVWLGPAIGPDAYEVGEDVYQAFLQQDEIYSRAFARISDKHWHLDLYSAARQRLLKLGVQQVYGGDYCTFSDKEKFYSYRRDGVTGRMASMIWINETSAR